MTATQRHGVRAGRAPSALMRGAIVLLAAAAGMSPAGCRGDESDKPPRQFFPDMDDQPKYKAQSRSTFFQEFVERDHGGLADWRAGSGFGRTMREPPKGSVPFGRAGHASAAGPVSFLGVDFAERADLLAEDDAMYRGIVGVLTGPDGKVVVDEAGVPLPRYAEYMPVTVDAELLSLGQTKYNIFCIACHGGTGAGDGTVGTRWAYPLPTFHDPKYFHGGEKGQDGYLFHVIRYGVPNPGGSEVMKLKMPAYGTKLSERESWAVVAYVRALQKTRTAGLGAVPEVERQRLERQRGSAATPAAPAPATPAAPAGGASANQPVSTQPGTEGTP